MAFRLRHKEARAYLSELLEKNNSFRILVEVGMSCYPSAVNQVTRIVV